MRRWNRLSEPLVSTDSVVVTSGHTTTSRPQITPLLTSSTATEPSASVNSTVPVRPPLFRLPLKAPDRMSVSGSHRHAIAGRPPVSGSTRASTLTIATSGRTRGCEPVDQSEDLLQGSLQLGVGDGVAEPHPTVVGKGAAGHQRYTFLLHELLAKRAARERLLLADAVHPEEKVERAVWLDELDAGRLAAKTLDQHVAAAPKRGHHARNLTV